MTRTFYFLDFLIYPLLVIAFLNIGLASAGWNDTLASVMLFLSGYASWTLFEYVLHRFVLHHVPVFARLHAAHHARPGDLIGTPTLLSVFLFFCLAFLPSSMAFGLFVSSLWSAGMLTGYLSYISVHYLAHHEAGRGAQLLRRLRRNHAVHHHHYGNSNFGVTTGIWDRLFRTHARRSRHRPGVMAYSKTGEHDRSLPD
jgi:sterol desaturase/sphingolipid hydroxylase (fatty acid hydroxylase superfamily)